MVDQTLVEKKLTLIKDSLHFLIEHKENFSAENIKKNFDIHLQVSHAIQILIQGSIDVCTHLASDEEWELPDNAAHTFKIALRHGVLTSTTADELTQSVKLRNVIVHQYDNLDETILEDVIKHKLPVFEAFIKEVRDWVKKRT